MPIKKILFFGLSYLLCLISVKAQDGVEDDYNYNSYRSNFQIWPAVKLSHDIKKIWTVSTQYMLRANITERHIRGHYISFGVKYKVHKYIFADAGFRIVTATNENNHYRFEVGFKPRYKYKNFTFSYRLAYFFQAEYISRNYQRGHEPSHYLRNKIEINWGVKPNWDVYVSAELYSKVAPSDATNRKISCIAGFSYEFKKNHTIDVYYRVQPDVQQKKLDLPHAIGIVYNWDIPKKFKKKKPK